LYRRGRSEVVNRTTSTISLHYLSICRATFIAAGLFGRTICRVKNRSSSSRSSRCVDSRHSIILQSVFR